MTKVRKDNHMGSGLLFELDDEWKRIRRIVTPTFSSKKLKMVRSKCIASSIKPLLTDDAFN